MQNAHCLYQEAVALPDCSLSSWEDQSVQMSSRSHNFSDPAGQCLFTSSTPVAYPSEMALDPTYTCGPQCPYDASKDHSRNTGSTELVFTGVGEFRTILLWVAFLS